MQRAMRLARILAPLLAALIAVMLTTAPASAAHNPEHCNAALEAAVISGQALVKGGYMQEGRAVANVIWNGYTYVCVLGVRDAVAVACTIFPCRDVLGYIERDAWNHGTTLSKTLNAKAISDWAKGVGSRVVLVVTVNPSLIDPSCYVVHQGRRVNVCRPVAQ
jgi:hypothetical protein